MTMTLAPLIISAPFGNYIQPAPEVATATLGTFTALRRPGRLWRIVKTVRYYRKRRAWVNKIGLRNPGVDWLVQRTQRGKINVAQRIVSVHGFNESEWFTLIDKVAALRPLAIELNMSCPNVGEIDWPPELFSRAVGTGCTIVVKLPPVRHELLLEHAMRAGVPWLHCCNTLPVEQGGMSGLPLKPESLKVVRHVREKFADGVKIIGGGGIYDPSDIDAYADAGADRFAIATKVFNPKYLLSHAGIAPLIERARDKASD